MLASFLFDIVTDESFWRGTLPSAGYPDSATYTSVTLIGLQSRLMDDILCLWDRM